MVAHELRMVIADMQKEVPQAKCSGFEQQFKVEPAPLVCRASTNFVKCVCGELWVIYTYERMQLLQELSQGPCVADVNYAKKASIMKRNRYKDRFPCECTIFNPKLCASYHLLMCIFTVMLLYRFHWPHPFVR